MANNLGLPVILPGAGRTYLELPDGLTWEQHEAIATMLGTVDRAQAWWHGDFLAAAEVRFGEQYAQLSAVMGVDEGTLMDRKWVASRYPRSRRRERLPWTFHQEVAALDPEVADALLAWCEEPLLEGADRHRTRAELRRRLAERREAIRGGPAPRPEVPWAPSGVPEEAEEPLREPEPPPVPPTPAEAPQEAQRAPLAVVAASPLPADPAASLLAWVEEGRRLAGLLRSGAVVPPRLNPDVVDELAVLVGTMDGRRQRQARSA